jgi:hypothetical protein
VARQAGIGKAVTPHTQARVHHRSLPVSMPGPTARRARGCLAR